MTNITDTCARTQRSNTGKDSDLLRIEETKKQKTVRVRREHPWQAPEYVMASTKPRTTSSLQKSDIFSLGVILSEIASMSLPRGT